MKNQVQNLLWIIFVLVSFISCNTIKEEPQISYKLKTFNYTLLQYDELEDNSYSNVSYTNMIWDSDFNGKLTLQYDEQNQISGTDYGASLLSIGTNQNIIVFSKTNIDKVQIKEDVVYTENNFPFASYSDTIKYILNNGKLIERKVYNQGLDYLYQYGNGKIIERLNGLQTTIFYLTDDNVTRIEKIQYNSENKIISKKEFIYSDYDQSINMLKGYYYIHGAFYNAFSKNNYKKREVNSYSYSNNQYTLTSTSNLSFEYDIDENNIPNLFEYEIY